MLVFYSDVAQVIIVIIIIITSIIVVILSQTHCRDNRQHQTP